VLTDEHIKPEVAHALLNLGFDVVCVRDRGLLGWKDWQLMPWCIREQRAICTRNVDDFEDEHQRCQDRGQEHFGVLIVGNDWAQAEIYWALRQYLEEVDPGLNPHNRVIALAPASEEYRQRHADEEAPV
jgi:hypothetical protein